MHHEGGVNQAQRPRLAIRQMTPVKKVHQTGVEAGSKAVDEKQNAVALTADFDKEVLNQVKKRKPLFVIRLIKILPEREAYHLIQGSPIINNKE